MIHLSEFPRSRSAYGTFLYSRIHHSRNMAGAPRKAVDILRGRGNSHTEAALIRKKKKKIPHKLHRPGQALMLL